MRVVKHPVLIVSTLLWIGFIGAISFMEAWLKFQAEGVSLPIGLSIGKLVFFALNKVEWVLALLIIVQLALHRKETVARSLWLKIPIVILIVQTFYFLPQLDHRADTVISGGVVEQSYMHLYYVVLEVVKITALIIYSVKAFEKFES